MRQNGQVLVKYFTIQTLILLMRMKEQQLPAKNFNQDVLEVNSQERAFINIASKVRYLEVRASSGGIVKLTGTTENQEVNVDLYGVYKGFAIESIREF